MNITRPLNLKDRIAYLVEVETCGLRGWFVHLFTKIAYRWM